jgi:hypothetical protein
LDPLDAGGDEPVEVPDAWTAPDAATDCENNGHLCVESMALACQAPDTAYFLLSCGPGRLCCEPATDTPAPCETSRGTCVVPGPLTCSPPNRYAEPEIYLCPATERCCLPPPPH